MNYDNQSDSVKITSSNLLFNNLKYITSESLDKYIESKLSLKYKINDNNYYYVINFHENKTIEIKDENNNLISNNDYIEVNCTNNYTSFIFPNLVGIVKICIGSSNDYIMINDEKYDISLRLFIVDNVTKFEDQGVYEISDLNKCIYYEKKDKNIYPYYVTNKYIKDNNDDNETLNYYGDLQTFEDYFFYNNDINHYKSKTIRLFSRSEYETALLIEFDPFNEEGDDINIGKCRMKIRTYFDNQFKEYIISVDLYYSIEKLVLWQKYFEENNEKFVIYYNIQDLKEENDPFSCPSISIFQNNIVINKIFPFSLVTYRFVYSVLTTHDQITKSDGTVKTPPYDKFYPDCLTITQDYPFKCSSLPSEIDVSDKKTEMLQKLGIQSDSILINEVPSNAIELLDKNRLIYFIIELKEINDGFDFDDSKENYYLDVIIYVENGKKLIKNMYNDKVFPLDDFLYCFDIYFSNDENDSLINEKDTFNKILIQDFLPVNTLYGQKKIIPMFFYYYNYYVSFYSNQQFLYSDELYQKILNNLKDYYNFEDFFKKENYILRTRLNLKYIQNVNFIIKTKDESNNKDLLLSDLYKVNNEEIVNNSAVINQIGISNSLDTKYVNIKDSKFKLSLTETENNIRLSVSYNTSTCCLIGLQKIDNTYYKIYNYLNDFTYDKNAILSDSVECYINLTEMNQMLYTQVLEMNILGQVKREKYIEKINPNTTIITKLLFIIKTKKKNGFILLSDYYEVNETETKIQVTKMIINYKTNNEIEYTDEGFLNLFEIVKGNNSLNLLFNGENYIEYKKNSNSNIIKKYNYIDLCYNHNTSDSDMVTCFVNF